ncbi:hypothetical protein BZARG_2225 [Bizionia argentinensis JUB59]|uniref:Uncharacterized protein n=1 Tax=Bizionia argentinensis JUB59 TaxID=1046627 RepID=G2EGB7_9FLAO|nr:DUF5996 family protein [Bizionia argentinensis]EGV42480.1 hypothetical protein BZARG_2225 [Bizionia argentinensis JUB59]
MSNTKLFPEFPLNEWIDTKETLHRYFQIVGKLRLTLNPKKNHWWHITLYTTTKGVTTRAIPHNDFSFEILFDFIKHTLNVSTSKGDERFFKLEDGLSVADFYKKLESILNDLQIEFDILKKPFDLSDDIPFDTCIEHHTYDKDAVHNAWKILLHIDMVFQEFSGRSYSKTCPVHIYWHHFDLVVTRFSGERGPDMGDVSQVEKEAYSHEVISFGFWFGDDTIKEPAFYSYTYPSPNGIDKEPLQPKAAKWQDSNGSPMALLLYKDIIESENPKKQILDFLESSYQAGAKLSGWDVEDLQVPS